MNTVLKLENKSCMYQAVLDLNLQTFLTGRVSMNLSIWDTDSTVKYK